MIGALAGATLVGAAASYYGSNKVAAAESKSADLQAEAARQSLEFQKEQYGNIKPYLMKSLEDYQSLLESPESVKKQPGYLFRLNEGLKAIGIPEGSRNLSGAQIKAITKYGQDYATQEYSNALARIAGLGELAQGIGATGANYASAAGNTLMQGAQARGAGITGAAQARASGYAGISGSIGTGLGIYAMRNMYQPNYSNIPYTSMAGPTPY